MCNKNLLNQVILILCIVLSYAAVDSSAEEQKEREYYLEPVVVCPSIFENYYSSTLRKIETIESLDDGNSDFIDENLNRISSLNMSRRGPMDIQSDLQIRGANFEQSDIVLNGIKLNDPQTGHFNLDMPFFLEDFEKISVI
ncbi:MAG: Plug domain-containing protein, partial [Candidatus Omnitrophica bacterium]|nr:Plug domain-containing protein [Candidatus Omnitrophota bacterium]